MAEMEQMAENNKAEEAQRAELEGQKQMQKFEGAIEKVKKKDAPKLQEHIQTHTERLEIWKQRLESYDIADYADAIAEAIALLETTENVIINIPEDLDDDATFMITAMCKEAGATTIAECNELIARGALTAVITSGPESYVPGEIPSREEFEGECTDSDGGQNYFVMGTTIGRNLNNFTISQTDICIDDSTLAEFLCGENNLMLRENNLVLRETYTCPNGCQDGACIQ